MNDSRAEFSLKNTEEPGRHLTLFKVHPETFEYLCAMWKEGGEEPPRYSLEFDPAWATPGRADISDRASIWDRSKHTAVLHTFVELYPQADDLYDLSADQYLSLVAIRRRLTLGEMKLGELDTSKEMLEFLEQRERFHDGFQRNVVAMAFKPVSYAKALQDLTYGDLAEWVDLEIDLLETGHAMARPACLNLFQRVLFPALMGPGLWVGKFGPLSDRLRQVDDGGDCQALLWDFLRALACGDSLDVQHGQNKTVQTIRFVSLEFLGVPLLSEPANGEVILDLLVPGANQA